MQLAPELIISSLTIVIGLVLLTYGADRFITGAAASARNFGVSPLLAGLTIVGFATSAPEMLVGGMAAWQGDPQVGIGNAVGSNIANIGLVLGATAIIYPLTVRSTILRKEFPIMLIAMLLALALLRDQYLSRADGIVLALGMIGLICITVYLGVRSGERDPLSAEFEEIVRVQMTNKAAFLWIAVGLLLLLVGSRLFVGGAVGVASWFGVSDLVIGLTVVAIGTSLPELAASVASALKHEPEIALGNVIGSNMFNMLGVLCVPALIRPTTFGVAVIERDMLVMFGLSIALIIMSFGIRGPGRINRVEGTTLLLSFFAYQYLLFANNGGH